MWAYEFYHAYFDWIPWEQGDKCWATKEEAKAAAASSAYPTRIIKTY